VAQTLKDRVALITGGGSGIGRAVAAALAGSGATAIVCGRTEASLRDTVSAIRDAGGRAGCFVADLEDSGRIRSLVSEVEKAHGRIDILINNASLLGPMVPLSDYPVEDWERVLRVNLTGLFVMTREVLKGMKERRSGTILNLTSSVGRRGRARWGAYAVSKFGVEGFTQTLADELRDTPIRVLAVNPGATRTRMRAEAHPEEDPATLKPPEAVAGVILRLIEDDDPALSGRSLDADALLSERRTR
jgi:NAD(P)-dependent dehydrogenase (short-subunit alcohol dehydrogenase family)